MSDNDREAFEVWFTPRALDLGAMWVDEWKDRDANGHYKDRAVWNAWHVWSMAIRKERAACLEAALEVGRTTGDTPDMAEYCADAIRARAASPLPAPKDLK